MYVSFVMRKFVHRFVARYKISMCRAFNPPNPYEGRKRAQDSFGGLPHSNRSIFHEDMTKEGCRMTLR